jgi:SNF2 family DNA or RNA helicase
MDYATPQAKEQAIQNLQGKIQSVEAQLQVFRDRLQAIQTEECPICYEDPNLQAAVLTPCCHRIFCAQCMLSSLKRVMTCPLCRAAVQMKDLTQIVKEKKKETKKQKEEKLLTKHKQLLQFLVDNPEAKVLVFSRYENPFKLLEQECEDIGVAYHTLRGNKDVIAATIRSFEQGEKRVLFLSTECAGAGINLVSATHVILYHAMTPEEEKQAVGRAYRLGRTNDLQVVRLLHEGEQAGQ